MHRTPSILLLAAVALAVGWFVLARRDQLASETAVPPLPAIASNEDDVSLGSGFAVDEREIDIDAVPDRGGFAEPVAVASARPDPRLFADEVPLRERIAELDRRARAGDAAAGCQLGIELIRCGYERAMAGYHATAEQRVQQLATQNLSADQLRGRVDFELGRLQNNRAVLASCEGVQAPDWAAPARYVRAAAEFGHRDAMRLFLDEDLWRTDVLMRDPSLVALLRRDAPRYFERLLQEGDPALISRLANVNGGDPLPEVLPSPWNLPGLGQELRRLAYGSNGNVHMNDAPVDADTVARAAEAYERWFARRDATLTSSVGDLRMGKVDSFGCESLGAGTSP